jgi:hypothetical protein
MFKAGKAALGAVAAAAAVAVAAPAASAATETTVLDSPLSFVVDDPCTGEAVLLEGTAHQVWRRSVSPSGTVTFLYTNTERGTGRTMLSPKGPVLAPTADYTFFDFYSELQRVAPDSSSMTQAGIMNVEHVGDSAVPDDFWIAVVYHTTAPSGGTPTTWVDVRQTGCR